MGKASETKVEGLGVHHFYCFNVRGGFHTLVLLYDKTKRNLKKKVFVLFVESESFEGFFAGLVRQATHKRNLVLLPFLSSH